MPVVSRGKPMCPNCLRASVELKNLKWQFPEMTDAIEKIEHILEA